MKKNLFKQNYSNLPLENSKIEKKRTTNINVLLNRVKINKRKEIKKRIVFLLLITLITIFAGKFFLF